MSETTTTAAKTTAEKAKAAGAKNPADKKKATSAKVKALQSEAAKGDRVVEVRGEVFTVHVDAYQQRMNEDYEFMEMAASGMLPAMLSVLLDRADHTKMKELARDEDTNKITPEAMSDLFQELMEAAGQGN